MSLYFESSIKEAGTSIQYAFLLKKDWLFNNTYKILYAIQTRCDQIWLKKYDGRSSITAKIFTEI